MLKLRIQGMTNVEIGKAYNASPQTVARAIEWAYRQGMVYDLENKVINDLIPKAIAIYAKQLDEGDPHVAKDVIDKLVKLGTRFEGREQAVEEVTLKSYLSNVMANQPKPPKPDTTIEAVKVVSNNVIPNEATEIDGDDDDGDEEDDGFSEPLAITDTSTV